MQEQRESLPIFNFKDDIVKAVMEHQMLVRIFVKTHNFVKFVD